MTNTKSTLAQTGLATLVLFGAVTLATTATADAKPNNGKRYQVMMKYDKNGDGKIGPFEQQAAISAKVQRIMSKADKNGDGLIGPFEMRTAPGRLSAWLGKADANHNGFVTRLELRASIASHWKSGVYKPWGNSGKGYKGNGYKGNGHKGKGYKGNGYKGSPPPAKPTGWLPGKPVPKAPPVSVRDHRQLAPKAPAANVRDHRKQAPPSTPLMKSRPTTKVPARKAIFR